MRSDLIDLDELLGDDKKVKVGGTIYTLPPDLPVELYFKINRFAGTDATDVEMIETLYAEVLQLFRYKNPDLNEIPLSLSQLVSAIGRIYGSGEVEDAPPPPARGSRSTSKKTAASKPRR